MRFIIVALMLSGLFISNSTANTLAQAQDLPTGTLAGGRVDPVPEGNLYVGVLDTTLEPGASTEVGGPPAFLINGQQRLEVSGLPQGSVVLTAGAAAFLPGGKTYKVANQDNSPARFRFVGMGAQGQVRGAQYQMEPIPWGPGAGKVYDVSVTRSFFGGGSATPWHYHNGPAFGIMDEGVAWENRQVDGTTRRIPMPGYYVQFPLKVHQLAQVGTGAYALIFQFAPPGQPLTGGGPAVGKETPTVLSFATSIPTAAIADIANTQTTRTPITAPSTALAGGSPEARSAAATALAARPVAPEQPDYSLLYTVLILGALVAGVLWLRRGNPGR